MALVKLAERRLARSKDASRRSARERSAASRSAADRTAKRKFVPQRFARLAIGVLAKVALPDHAPNISVGVRYVANGAKRPHFACLAIPPDLSTQLDCDDRGRRKRRDHDEDACRRHKFSTN